MFTANIILSACIVVIAWFPDQGFPAASDKRAEIIVVVGCDFSAGVIVCADVVVVAKLLCGEGAAATGAGVEGVTRCDADAFIIDGALVVVVAEGPFVYITQAHRHIALPCWDQLTPASKERHLECLTQQTVYSKPVT
jgi:hypothetical protein